MSIEIQLKNICKSYKTSAVLKQLNMTVYQGDIYGLAGDKNSGKTTALKTLLGMTPYQSGEIYVQQKKILSNKIPQSSIGVSLDNSGFYSYLSGEKNLMLYADLLDVPYKKVQEVLSIVQLNSYKKKKVSQYTPEMIQCLSIARAFLSNPEIIILDEPTSNLSKESTQNLHSIIKSYAKEYIATFIYCTRSLSHISQICNRAGLMKNGYMEKESSIRDFIPKKTTSYEIVSMDIQRLIYILNGHVKLSQTSNHSILVELEQDNLNEINKFLMLHNIDVVSLSRKENVSADIFV